MTLRVGKRTGRHVELTPRVLHELRGAFVAESLGRVRRPPKPNEALFEGPSRAHDDVDVELGVPYFRSFLPILLQHL